MNEAEDRLLDFALERHFGSETDADADVTEAVVSAWAQGERGSLTPAELERCARAADAPFEPDVLRPEESTGSDARPGSVLRPLAWAGALAAASILVFVVTRPDGPPSGVGSEAPGAIASGPEADDAVPFAESVADVTLLRGPAWDQLVSRTAEPGERQAGGEKGDPQAE